MTPWLLHITGAAHESFATERACEAFAAAYVAPWTPYTVSYFAGRAW